MLRYFLWITRFSGKAQWALVIGAYLVYKLLGALARSRPSLAPFIQPILWAYGLFALLTWLSEPIFNLMLRFNRLGRMALSKEQISGSNAIALCLFPALALSGFWFATGGIEYLLSAGYFGLLMLPVAGAFKVPEGWPRRVMTAYTAAMAAVGLGFFFIRFLPVGLGAKASIARTIMGTFFLAAFLSQFVANGLALARVRR
jgi:hypothetical protein